VPRPPNPELPRQLLDAALELLDERGDAAFSMRELAARVGYAVTAVYRCYNSRADLLRALQVRLYKQLAAHVDPPEASGLSLKERVLVIGESYLSWALTHRARYLFMFHTSETYLLLSENERAMARTGFDAFETMLATADGAALPPSASATYIFATLHGLASLALTERFKDTEAEELLTFYAAHQAPYLAALLGDAKD